MSHNETLLGHLLKIPTPGLSPGDYDPFSQGWAWEAFMPMRTLFTKIIHEKHLPEDVLYEAHVCNCDISKSKIRRVKLILIVYFV